MWRVRCEVSRPKRRMKGFLLELATEVRVAWPCVLTSYASRYSAEKTASSDFGHTTETADSDAVYCAITMGARQKFAFEVAGSRTVTWQSYCPGLSPAALTLKLKGVTPRRVAALGETAIGCVLNASAAIRI